jgi:hypothetical protein
MNRWTRSLCALTLSSVSAAGCGDAALPGENENDVIAEATGALASCAVIPEKELLITHPSVVGDERAKGMGSWSFGNAMRAMAGTRDVQAFVTGFVESWLTDQTVEGQVIAARRKMEELVLAPWRARSVNGRYDLDKAPMRLLAVVYRADLRKQTNLGREAGEGRFVYVVQDVATGEDMQFTIILEYGLAVREGRSAADWARDWHSLGALDLGSPGYNAKLEEITNRFAGAEARAGVLPGASLNQARTNEIELTFLPIPVGQTERFLWQLREFHIDADGMLRPARVALTPHVKHNGTALLGEYVNQHESAILAGTHKAPAKFQSTPFNGGSSEVPRVGDIPGNEFQWNVPNVKSEELRTAFSINTCNGCHAGETGTRFLHVGPGDEGGTELSEFVVLEEFPRRVKDLKKLLGCQ